MNDASETVTIKLAELLRHPDDLEKIPALKSEFLRKKAAVDSSLRLGLQEQLSITQNGMTSISNGQRTVNQIKDEMMKIDKLCAEAQNMIRDFPHINLVANAQRNFSQVEGIKKDVDGFEEVLGRLEDWLREDDGSIEEQPNLLQIHYELTKLRDIRDLAVDQARNGGEEAMELINNLKLDTGVTLQELFTRLDEVIDWFDDHVGQACLNLIELVQSGNNGMIVRLALIIQEEEKSDKKAQALQDAQREYKELASKFKSITTAQKELRGYKEKFLKAITYRADTQMEESKQAFNEDSEKLEKSLRWFFNDLNTVKLGMVTLMPKKWKIFNTYVKIYHTLMHDWLVPLIDNPDLLPLQMLAIVNWEPKYYSKMKKLGADDSLLQPNVLDNRGTELIRDYRGVIVKAVENWMDRMATTDRQQFLSRADNALDQDENGCLRTKTLGDMWRMLREQLSVAESSERHDVVEGVVEAMFTALTSRQRMWEGLITSELQKYSIPSAETEGLQGFQDWLVAIANDQIACIDDGPSSQGEAEGGVDGPSKQQISFLTRFTQDVHTLVSPAYKEALDPQIESLRFGYIDLSTACLSTFASLIFAVDFRALVSEFFTPAWYSKKAMGQAISTFDDYLGDYADVLHASLREVLVEELADELLIRYLSSVRNKGAKFKRTDPYIDKMKDDVVTVFDFFQQFAAFEEIKNKWRVVEGFVQLVSCEKQGVAAEYEGFKTQYWDAGIGWVEAVLRCRDDFDRGMLNGVKARAGEMEVVRGAETIMSKVK